MADQRRYENRVAGRQGRLWQAAVGLDELPPFPFACECGRSGCDATWSGTPNGYDSRAADGPVTADLHNCRIGTAELPDQRCTTAGWALRK